MRHISQLRHRILSLLTPRRSQGWGLWLSLGLGVIGILGAPAALVSERFIAPGTRHLVVQQEEGPVMIHILEWERGNPYVHPEVILSGEHVIGLETVRAGAERLSEATHYAVGGINGDFYRLAAGPFQGDPLGLTVSQGEILSSPCPRSAFVLTADGTPFIDVFQLEASVQALDGSKFSITGVNQERSGSDLILYTPRFYSATRTQGPGLQVLVGGIELPIRLGQGYRGRIQAIVDGQADVVLPEDSIVLSGSGEAAEFLGRLGLGENLAFRLELRPSVGEVQHAVGGGPRLVRAGQISIEADKENFDRAFVDTPNPRTAVGFNQEKIFLVTVDGRQPGYSAGMSLLDLAELMVMLGCQEALNLDGGGSTTMVVRGKVVNRPSDQRERPVANALLLFSTAPQGPLARLTITPDTVDLMSGGRIRFSLRGEDEYFNPVAVRPQDLTWTMEPDLGTVDSAGVLFATKPGTAILRATAGQATAEVRVHIHEQIVRLEIQPSPVKVGRGGEQQLTVQAWTSQGQPIPLAPSQVEWMVPPELGHIDPHQVFRAADTDQQGVLRARAANMETQVQVLIGSLTRLIDDFEDDRLRLFRSYPASVPGSLQPVTEPRHHGEYALQLKYDFTTTDVTRAAYAVLNRDLGAPSSVSVWVYGDGSGNWLRGRFIDANGQKIPVDFIPKVDFQGEWRQFRAPIPAGTAYPIRWESIYLVQSHAEVKNKGVIYFDQLEAEYPPE